MAELMVAGPAGMQAKPVDVEKIMNEQVPLGAVTVAGWIRTIRGSKKWLFIEVNDGTTPLNVQVVAGAELPNFEEVQKLTTGASVAVSGELVQSQGKGQKFEIQAKAVVVFGEADPDEYPLQKKKMTYEYLREIAHLRGRTSTIGSLLRIRSKVSKFIHDYFDENGFIYVHTPVLTTSECEGGVQPFLVTTLPLENVPRTEDGTVDYSQDFFGAQALLSGSGQLHGELVACGMGRIYTFGPSFRAENSNTSRHLAEFWHIEPEMAFYDLDMTIGLGQDLIRYIIKRYLSECAADVENLVKLTGEDPRANLELTISRDLIKVSYTDAIAILKASGKEFVFPVEWGMDLQGEHERYLCEEHYHAPIAIFDYPEALKSFYMYVNDDNLTVHGADILVPGVGEIIGASQREHRYGVLLERMQKKGMTPESYEWFLATRRFGTVPHAGFGMGLERLLMWLTGMGNIREVIPFPRSPKNCLF